MNSNQSLCWGLLLNIVLFVTWPGLSQTTWTGGGGNMSVTNAANWSNGVPNNSSNKGIVGTDGIVSWVVATEFGSKDITFTNNAKLITNDSSDDLKPITATLTFNDTSQFSLTNSLYKRSLRPQGNATINLNDSATISANRIYAIIGNNNRFNQTGNSQMSSSREIDLSQTFTNIFTLAGGKVTAGTDFKASSVRNSYFTFTSTSTGIMQKNGANYVADFTTLITNGGIRINGVVQVDTNFFIMSYDGVNTTLTLGSSHLPSVTVAPTAVTVVSGNTLTLTATPEGAAPYYFQWYTNGVAIANATNNPLVFPNVKYSGNWSVTMMNVYGSASASSVVTVVPAGTMVSFQ